MARDATVATANAAAAQHVRPFLLVELDFASGIVYLNNTDRTLTWNGHDYLGAGNLGKINLNDETAELQANGISMQLTGIPGDFIALALDEDYQGRRCSIYIGFLNDSYAVIADPALEFQGRMDQMAIELGDMGTVTLTAENRLADWERPRTRFYTDDDQKSEFPGDRGFEFVTATVANARNLTWGSGGAGNVAAAPAPAALGGAGVNPAGDDPAVFEAAGHASNDPDSGDTSDGGTA